MMYAMLRRRKRSLKKLILIYLTIVVTFAPFLVVNHPWKNSDTNVIQESEVDFSQAMVDSTKDQSIEERSGKRLAVLRKVCKSHAGHRDLSGSLERMHYLLDAEHKIMMCLVDKNGCTNWRRMFMLLTKVTNKDPFKLSQHQVFHSGIQMKFVHDPYATAYINTLYKFMFVRNPWSRLVSAFSDKAYNREWYESKHKEIGQGKFRRIRDYVYANLRGAEEKGGERMTMPISHFPWAKYVLREKYSYVNHPNVTFEEFLTYVAQAGNSGTIPDSTYGINSHWHPQSHWCHPCSFERWDFIGKFEYFTEEANYVMRKLNLTMSPDHLHVTFPEKNAKEYVVNTESEEAEKMRAFYGDIPKHLRDARRLYFMDFKMFDYPNKLDFE